MRLLLMSEYTTHQSPVGTLNVDFIKHFSTQKNYKVACFSSGGKYYPGGFHPVRLWHLVWMHLCVLPVLLFQKIAAMVKREPVVVVVTTSPPNLHLNVLFWAQPLGLRVVVWFQDAHPEAEARLLERRGYARIAAFLRGWQSWLMPLARCVVPLDKAMEEELAARVRRQLNSVIIAPWATYMLPAKPMRAVQMESVLKLIYAGNYGYAHDLSPLVGALMRLPTSLQQRVQLTFIGMNESAQQRLAELFKPTQASVEFKKRLKTVEELALLFADFHYGIVSLAASERGLACPSKAFTYLSQGLPILYVGPQHTLSDTLVDEGWGERPSQEFFDRVFSISRCDYKVGQVFPNPTDTAFVKFDEIMDSQLQK